MHMPVRTMGRGALVGAGLLLALLTVSCDRSETGKGAPDKPAALQPLDILIDWQAEPTYLGIFHAKHKGYFQQAGYAAKITQSWGANQAVSAIASGEHVIGTASGGATILGRNSGANVVSLGVLYPHIPTVIYGLAETGIKVPADLKGKKVGVYPGSVTSNEFDAFLEVHGMSRKDMQVVSLNGADIPVLLAHQVDAVLHYTEMSPVQVETNPEIPGQQGSKTFELKLADLGVGGYGLDIIANPKAWVEDRAKLVAVRDAIVRGYKDGCANPDEAVDAFTKEFPDKAVAYVSASWGRVCGLVGTDPGTQTAKGWQDTIDLYRKLGLLTADVTPAQVMGE